MTKGLMAAEAGLEPFPDLIINVLEAFDVAAGALRGSRCADCGRHVFPAAWVCYVCRGTNLDPVALPTTGTLYTFTWVSKKDPADSYGLGYIDLSDDVRILARLRGSQADFACELEVRLGANADGSWYFAP